jgi:hypothetical protein
VLRSRFPDGPGRTYERITVAGEFAAHQFGQ